VPGVGAGERDGGRRTMVMELGKEAARSWREIGFATTRPPVRRAGPGVSEKGGPANL